MDDRCVCAQCRKALGSLENRTEFCAGFERALLLLVRSLGCNTTTIPVQKWDYV